MPESPKQFNKRHAPRPVSKARTLGEDPKAFLRRASAALQQQQLAQAKGLALPDQDDFSLAELYCGTVTSPQLNADRQIGFAQ